MYPQSQAERVIVEGEVLYRDRQKWRPRWCCLKKTNPTGIALTHLLVYQTNVRPDPRTPPSERHSLEDFCGLECGRPLESQNHVMSVVMAHITYTFAFPSIRMMEQWGWAVKREFGSEWTFDVKVLPSQKKIQPGEATLRFFPSYFSLTAGNPCTCLGYWMHNQLRRYGGSTGFSFEAGSKSYGGEGVYKLESRHGARIKDLFDRVANNKSLPDPPSTLGAASSYRTSPSDARAHEISPYVDATLSPPVPTSSLDAARLYTPPPSAGGMDTMPRAFPTSPSTLGRRGSATSPEGPGQYSPTRRRLPPPPPEAELESSPYQNVKSPSSTYDYVHHELKHREIADGKLIYAQLEPSVTPAEGLSGSVTAPPTRGDAPAPTDYGLVDFDRTRNLRQALGVRKDDLEKPLEPSPRYPR